MMRGFIVIITALFSMAFLGKKQYCHHWTALITIVFGVLVVGASAVLFDKKKDDKNEGEEGSQTTALGIILILAAQCFTGLQFIAEEKILSGYYLDPLLVVGLEGFWGCCYYAILLPIFQQINCENSLCHGGKLEDTSLVWIQMKEKPELIGMAIGIIFSIGSFNACGVAVTKFASAAQRSTIDTCRTLLIWIIFLGLPNDLGGEDFIWEQIIGFVLLVGGTLVYNEIVTLPCTILNQNTKANLIKKQGKLETFRQDGQNPDYMSSSPHAAYDANRMKRNVENKYNERYDIIEEHNDKMQLVNHSENSSIMKDTNNGY